MVAMGSVVAISMELSIPRAALILSGVAIRAATEVTGVITNRSLCSESLLTRRSVSRKFPESTSVPPMLVRLPEVYFKEVNLPSESEVVLFSPLSRMKLLFSSTKISASMM